jgi:hypothetical protein
VGRRRKQNFQREGEARHPGAFSREYFREHFEQAALGTPVEGARLEIDVSSDETDPHAQDILLEGVDVEDE